MKTLAKFFAVVVIFFSLQGCHVALLAGGAAATSSMLDEGKPKVILEEGIGGKTDTAALKEVKSIITNNEIAASYLKDYEVFDRVVLTSQNPLTNAKAAEVAKANNVDGFLFSNPGEGSRKNGLVLQTVVYGTVTTAIVDKAGKEIYRQKVSLERGALHADDLLDREIIDALATEATNDIKVAQNLAGTKKVTAQAQSEGDKETGGWLQKVNPFGK